MFSCAICAALNIGKEEEPAHRMFPSCFQSPWYDHHYGLNLCVENEKKGIKNK